MAADKQSVTNPFTDEPLSDKNAETVLMLRQVRRGSRNAMRSGNPAKRAEAERINDMTPNMIHEIYWSNR